MNRYTSVPEFIAGNAEWKDVLVSLRKIIKTTELQETIKWGMPVYTVDGKNVAGIGAFKSYCGLWFFNGVFLVDSKKKLTNAQEGKTKAMRQWRFQTVKDIQPSIIKAYLKEAIQNEKKGKKVALEKKKSTPIPEPLKGALAKQARLKASFEKLTPGRQRDYASYIAEAKRGETKLSRLAKIKPMILAGIGLNDKYKG